MLRFFLYTLMGMCITGCPSAMLGTAILGTSIADERTIGMQIDDIAITSKIMARLTAESDMPSRWLSIDSIEGKVSLMGYLTNQEQINRAIFIAKSFQGVKSVHSEIKVGEPSLKSIVTDSWITAKVKTRLLKDGKTSGISIHVETIEGRVYLQGMARNDEQYQRALELASTTPGVREVVDMLKINPHGTETVVRPSNKNSRHSGSRKSHPSKLKPAGSQSHVVADEAPAPSEVRAETVPLSTLKNHRDIFEETVSAIKKKHKPKSYDRFEPHQEDDLHSNSDSKTRHKSHKHEASKSSDKSEDKNKISDKKSEVIEVEDDNLDLKSRKNTL